MVTKTDAILAPSPTFRCVSIESSLHPDCNTVLNPIPGILNALDKKEDDTVWDKGDYGTNSEVTWDNESDESFSKHMILTVEWPVWGASGL
ncbi:hypothetical protein TNCV_1456381 [Trichonephila clavipes]|nr:hypothetical protein TNCV_1456381 [Trichonephila clavipes]